MSLLPDHQTVPPVPPSIAPAPGLCGTPGYLGGRLQPWEPEGQDLDWKQPVQGLYGVRPAVCGLQVHSDNLRAQNKVKH